MIFAFITSESGHFPTAWMCRRLGVSTSGYHRWNCRKPSRRSRRDNVLRLKIRAYHSASRYRYGSPRIQDDLIAEGEHVSRKRVARLMREMGLYGRLPKRWKRTTQSNHDEGYAPNLVKQNFHAARPNELWMADISYVRTWAGWMFLAVIIDAFSRRVVGYAIDDHMRADLAIAALAMAVERRRPSAGLVHHSDRGVQYACEDYRDGLAEIDAHQSMSDTGNCFDNAAAESFFSTIKEELIYRHSWPTKGGVAREVVEYIENFYNLKRRHSTIGRVSPVDYELTFMRGQAA